SAYSKTAGASRRPTTPPTPKCSRTGATEPKAYVTSWPNTSRLTASRKRVRRVGVLLPRRHRSESPLPAASNDARPKRPKNTPEKPKCLSTSIPNSWLVGMSDKCFCCRFVSVAANQRCCLSQNHLNDEKIGHRLFLPETWADACL